jgi:hypothetical protein
MKFKVKITQEVIDATCMCGKDCRSVVENCLFAYCYNQLIPKVKVRSLTVDFFSKQDECMIWIDHCFKWEIALFDIYRSYEERRKNFLGKEYELEIPDQVIEYWRGDVVEAVQKLINEGNKILMPI